MVTEQKVESSLCLMNHQQVHKDIKALAYSAVTEVHIIRSLGRPKRYSYANFT